MPFVPLTNTCLLELIFDYYGEVVENTLHFRGTAAWTEALMNTLAGEVISWWNVNIRPSLSADLTLMRVKVTDQESQIGPAVEYTTGLPLSGGVSATPGLPGNVACVVSFRTANRGRNYRGRNYIAGIPEGSVTGNELAGAFITAMDTGYEALLTTALANSADLVVASRYFQNAPRVAGITSVVTSIIVDDRVDSQRRRLQGRGS